MCFRVAEKRLEKGKEARLDSSSLAVLVARVGATDQKIVTSTIEEGRFGSGAMAFDYSLYNFRSVEMGKPLHSLVLPGNCHYLEQEALNMWKL